MLASIYGLMAKHREAATQFRKVIKLQPAVLIAHDGLGVVLSAMGDYEAAGKAFRDALALQPDNADILIKLGYTLAHCGKLDDSEECLQRALHLKPSSADIIDALGDIRYQKEQYHDAIKYYEQAVAADPSRIDSFTYMGNSLLRLGNSGKAIPCFEKVIALDSDNMDALIHLGHALRSVGEPGRAEQYYQKALALEPDNLIAIAGLVNLYEKQGFFEKAYEQLLPLIQQNKASTDIAAAFVRLCHRFENCDEAINYALKALEDETLAAPDRANLEYALGRRFDSQGDFDLAFTHYQLANTASMQTFDSARHAAFIESLIQVVDVPFFIRAARSKVRSERPVFIVGMPRSGTSLVEQILASHPRVFGAGELNDISEAVKSITQIKGEDALYPFNLDALTGDQLDTIANSYLEHLNELDSASVRVTDKYPTNFLHLGLIAMAFPDARVIHCTRDPLDTCLSIYFQGFSEAYSFANKLEDIGFYYRQYDKLMQHFKSLNILPILDVAYEELVANQDEVSRKLIDFIGLDWDEKCLQFHQNDRFVATPSYDQVREKMYSSSVGRWKNYEKHLAPLVKALEQ